MDLFDFNEESVNARPLAERMRANNLNDFIGQRHIVAEGSLLRRAISLDRLGSCIFYGPPGTGKTTLANIIAQTTHGEFIKLNAVQAGVADVKKAVQEAENNLKMFGKRTYLMLDECHRFNKTQSDSLLPAIEQGTIIFIGSTTENPYASMTPAIVSRCRVFEFKRLSSEDIMGALQNALKDKRRGLGALGAKVEEDALRHIAVTAGGDLRTAYNALELAVLTTPPENGIIHVALSDAEQSIQRKALSYNEDDYYNYLSAFCKSLRGSDANAALYYAMRLISGGCDPMLVARRLCIHSAEDVGMADPRAMQMASSAMYILEKTGAPEGLIPLSEAIIYVCEAPKSSSVKEAMFAAKEDAENVRDDGGVPSYLKDHSYDGREGKAEAAKYKYPHNYPNGYVEQQYLPDAVKDKIYYTPKDRGYERTVSEIRRSKGKKN